MESPETDPHKYGRLMVDQKKKKDNTVEQSTHTKKGKTLYTDLKPYMKINS